VAEREILTNPGVDTVGTITRAVIVGDAVSIKVVGVEVKSGVEVLVLSATRVGVSVKVGVGTVGVSVGTTVGELVSVGATVGLACITKEHEQSKTAKKRRVYLFFI